MKVFIKKVFTILVLTIILVPSFLPIMVGAQQYQLLAPLENTPIGTSVALNEGGLSKYIQDVFNLALGAAIALSVIMIVIGGFQYLSTDAISGKGEGKERITAALTGLFIALAGYLILSTINPNLLNINFVITPLPAPTSTSTPITPVTATTTTPNTSQNSVFNDDRRVRSALLSKAVTINKPACTRVGQTNCTNVGGLPDSAINGLGALKTKCGCVVQVTGGTEYWLHQTHGPGRPAVDLNNHRSLNNYLTGSDANPNNGTRVLKDGATYVFETEGSNQNTTGAHWHVIF